MANELIWTSQSGYLYSAELNKRFQKQAQPLTKFRQFCAIKEAFGKGKGETVNWLKVSNASAMGRVLSETEKMPETTAPLALGTVSVDEYGLSIPFTFKLSALSEFDIEDIVRGALLDDCAKVIDGMVERQFNAALLRGVGADTSSLTVTTDGTATATNTSALNTAHVLSLRYQLKKRNVPGFPGLNGDYACIAGPLALSGVLGALVGIYQYTELGLKNIVAGEVGRFAGVRFVEDTYAIDNAYDSTAGTASAITWTKGSSSPAYMFGAPTVREAVAVPEEIRVKIAEDYGRSRGIAWYGIFGWKIEWDTSGGADSRIIKWDSKA